jgi:hypothetical protein
LATPEGAVAVAVKATVAGAATVLPDAGFVSFTVDVVEPTVTVTGAEATVLPTLSVATAVRV